MVFVSKSFFFNLGSRPKSDFDFNFHTARQFQFHQGIDGLGTAAVDIKQTFVRRKFELFPRFFVHESGTVHGEDLFVRRQGNGSVDHRPCELHRLYDFFGRLVDQIVIVRFEFDSDSLTHG